MDKRLTLRRSMLADCEQFCKWEQTKEVTEFFSIPDSQTYETVVREFVLHDADGEKEQYTIVECETGNAVGRVVLYGINRALDSFEVYRIYIGDTKNRGKGYGREALKLVLDRAFRHDTFERVYLDYYTGNTVAQSLYESMGFEHEGVARSACKKMGVYRDVCVMAILRKDYERIYG